MARLFDYLISFDYGKTYRMVAVNLTEDDANRIAAMPRSRNVVRGFVTAGRPDLLTGRVQ
jgi:hypothetical protein